eukprot:327310-Pleurochrysis_carterae.AAC.1
MLRRGGWTRLRAVSGQGRRGRRRRPCARRLETQSTEERAPGTHAMRAQKRQACMRNGTKGLVTAFA